MAILNDSNPRTMRSILIELVIIIISINIALWVDNLNESYKSSDLELKLLRELSQSLQVDLEDIEGNLTVHERGIQGAERFFYEINKKEIEKDSVYVNYLRLVGWSFLNADRSTYESIKSFGIQLIQNDSLRRLITELYTVKYQFISVLDQKHMLHKKDFEDYFRKYMDVNYLRWDFINLKEMKNDKELKVLIKYLSNSHHGVKGVYTHELLEHLKALIQALNTEIKQRDS